MVKNDLGSMNSSHFYFIVNFSKGMIRTICIGINYSTYINAGEVDFENSNVIF